MNSSARILIESLPFEALRPSAAVDALHMAAGTKKAMRTRLVGSSALDAVTAWAEGHGLALTPDGDGYVCIAADRTLADLVLKVDRMTDPHEARLGRLLGYPSCCCGFVADRGEDRIDELAAEVALWKFEGDFILIDPRHYLAGSSLVCHLPCSPTCGRSLALARAALCLIRVHQDSVFFRRWAAWLDVPRSS